MENDFKKVWYQWHELVDTDDGQQLLQVQRDPRVYEYSVGELLFPTPKQAAEHLVEREIDKEPTWRIARVTYELCTDDAWEG